MGDEADLLRAILSRFAHDPNDAELWSAARELADRFTLDQLCAMAPSDGGEVARLFDRILGKAMRRDRRDARRAPAVGERPYRWGRRHTDGHGRPRSAG